MAKTAILYVRVSTDEQAEHGYSLGGQIEELREYANRQGMTVVDEIVEDGYSGASRSRPGLTRIRELVANSHVDVILATKWDRFFRRASYQDLFAYELKDFGTELQALNGQPDDNPAGRMFNRMLASFAEYERDLITERSAAGRMGRAKAGKVLPGRQPPYGFVYVPEIGNYRVDSKAMQGVRLAFRTVAETGMIGRAKAALENAGYEPRRGGRYWNKTTIKEMIENDAYKPHTHEQVSSLVEPAVAVTLDPSALYGIQWYNRRLTEKTPDGDRARTVKENDPSKWVAIPVPDAGVSLEHVTAARKAVQNNVRTAKAGFREWPLKGHIYCPCGRAMTAFNARRTHFYYVCGRRVYHGKDSCEHAKYWPAAKLELRMQKVVSDLTQNPDVLTDAIRAKIDKNVNRCRTRAVTCNVGWTG